MPTASSARWSPSFARRTQGASGELAAILALAGGTDGISFAGGLPNPLTFPVAVLADLSGQVLQADAAVALQYSPTPGLPGLRDALAARLALTQDRRPDDEELMVTSGTIDALGLIAKAMLDRGDVVAVEAPTYLGAIDAFRSYEADVRGIPVDGDGMDIEALHRLCRSPSPPKLLYTIPDHQNPTGITMSAARRTALVEVCRDHGVLVFEDVAYRELTFTAAGGISSRPDRASASGAASPIDPSSRPGAASALPPTLWSLAPDIVVQAGTTSKTFFPGVRLGWAAGPKPVIEQMVIAKQNSDQCAGAFGQRLLERYLRGGHMDAQLPLSNALYAARCALMLAALDEHMPRGVTWTQPRGGFFTWLSVPPGLDTTVLAQRARAAGVAFVPGRPFYTRDQDRSPSNLRLSFSLASDDQIDEGVRRLGSLITTALEMS